MMSNKPIICAALLIICFSAYTSCAPRDYDSLTPDHVAGKMKDFMENGVGKVVTKIDKGISKMEEIFDDGMNSAFDIGKMFLGDRDYPAYYPPADESHFQDKDTGLQYSHRDSLEKAKEIYNSNVDKAFSDYEKSLDKTDSGYARGIDMAKAGYNKGIENADKFFNQYNERANVKT